MNTRIAITHSINQRFDRKVGLSTHWLRLRPAPHTRSLIEAYSLKVFSEPHFLNWLRDPYENHLARLDLPEPVSDLRLEVEVLADLPELNPFDFLVEPYASSFPFDYPEQLRKELAPYLKLPKPGPKLAAWFSGMDIAPGYIVERLGDINLKFYNHLPAFGALQPGAVDPESVLTQGGGSAWEIAWLATLTLRKLGLASRFTSGYHVALAPGEGGYDIARLHAWTEVYLPGAGWVGLDPAGGVYASEGHIPLASAPEYLRTLPVMGYYEHCQAQQDETATVRRLTPTPALWPFSGTQWSDIRALGHTVDEDIQARGIDLNMGHSLSFVSAYNPGAPEWNSAAMGPDKTRAAEELLQRLKKRLAPGGILHLGQGEWMGGESAPRWRLSAFFRKDGFPIWRDEALIGKRQPGFKPTGEDAARFAEELASSLGLNKSFVTPAYEDGLHQFWQHRNNLSTAPDPEELRDPERRRALAARLTGHDSEPAGYVLPLRWDPVSEAWSSGSWSFRRGRLVLSPGDFALGYRLPLDSLPVGDAAAAEQEPERCQFDERPLLPRDFGELNARFISVGHGSAELESADPASTDSRPPRTALCVQVRHGQIHVFLPPLSHLEHYLALVAAIEHSAAQAGVSVMLEGYEPPEDHRLRRLTLEPDAGCLKLALPEVDSTPSQIELLESAFTEAANTGLRAERVMSDGKSLPPGGRGDIRLGGTVPANSPFFRRPELLRSLIAYWQRHPSLSYLFAGTSIGPGGSAPRPDEGRDDALYELGIALERIPAGDCATPWIPDRLLRHLLADPAGEMRRAEIRVDQLYPPDRTSLRLGRTILRAFETPPHPRLAALQGLLIKGLLARFAAHPYREDLVDFGSALHDRFMLPAILWSDLLNILDDLKAAGLPFQAEWFRPLLELRFPIIGKVSLGNMTLELRAAHEPWPILAEETTGAGTARFVDSANERVQVCCGGLTPGRHVLICNGYRVPLKPNGGEGELVAGIRFKANEPVSSLHPTRPAVHALVLDLVDTWTGRVIGGCTYIPPRPEMYGATAAPPRRDEGGDDPARHEFRTIPVRVPPFSTGAAFFPQGSGQAGSVPPVNPEDRYPYLLDLVRL